ncbi:unnamed protein product [Ambrosiozyma monospora]|uniref:Unnamed protein product n=1 Tax=Ambrosiozyma monospora TaxID=43982 RepID=A0ACB5TLU1_AMBMO|nr:unnamed protein product [Ambrosiozyma monospora]
MFCVVVSSFGVCLAQVGVLALVNVEGAIYANANVVGNAVAGVLPSISMIAAVLLNTTGKGSNEGDSGEIDQMAADKSRVREAIIYFLVSALVASSVLVFVFLLRKFEREQQQDSYQKLNPDVSIVPGGELGNDGSSSNIFVDDVHDQHDDIESSETEEEHVNIPFSQLWFYLKYVFSSIFLTFALTLIFPVYASSVESTGTLIEKKLFIPLAFLVWNAGDLAGRIICAFPKVEIKNQKLLIAYSISRSLFVPLFMGCNIKNRGEGFIGDIGYLILQFLFGLTNGHIFSSCFMLIGELLNTDKEKKAAAGYTALLVNLSLLFGSVLSYVFTYWIS